MAWVNLLDIVYPVGSLYFTNNDTSPAAIVGGSWAKIEEAAIRSGDTVGYVGADEHAITVDEMPSHTHDINLYYHSNGGGHKGVNRSQWSNANDSGRRFVTGSRGGGKRCRLFNVLTIVISTIAQHKNKGGL